MRQYQAVLPQFHHRGGRPAQESCAEAPILEKSDGEIRCAWPEDYGPEVLRRTLWASVTKGTDIDANPPDVDRTAHAAILP